MGVHLAERVSSAINALRRDANLEAVLAAILALYGDRDRTGVSACHAACVGVLKEYSLLTCLG